MDGWMVSRLSERNVHEEVLKICIYVMLSHVHRLSGLLSAVSCVYPQLQATGNQIKRADTLRELLDFSGLNVAANIWANGSTQLNKLLNVEMLRMTHPIVFERAQQLLDGWQWTRDTDVLIAAWTVAVILIATLILEICLCSGLVWIKIKSLNRSVISRTKGTCSNFHAYGWIKKVNMKPI